MELPTTMLFLMLQEISLPVALSVVIPFYFDKVVLDDGKNVLKASLLHQGKEYTDEIEWNYNGECNREADFLEHKKEHGSW